MFFCDITNLNENNSVEIVYMLVVSIWFINLASFGIKPLTAYWVKLMHDIVHNMKNI